MFLFLSARWILRNHSLPVWLLDAQILGLAHNGLSLASTPLRARQRTSAIAMFWHAMSERAVVIRARRIKRVATLAAHFPHQIKRVPT